MTERRQSGSTIPEEFGGLVSEFRGLLEKYPQAADHFSLAYHPAGLAQGVATDPTGTGTDMTVGFTQPVFECSEIEPGFVVCDRVDEQ